jgi:DNA-binding transcriptional LysR family regulator
MGAMELRHLRYFVAVARSGGFARAAASLNVAQPALSKQIMNLERELGVRLFDRLAQGVRLTPDGSRFLADALHLLAGAERAVRRARSRDNDRVASVSIGYAELLSYFRDVSAVLHGFRMMHPDIPLHADQMDRPDLRSALREERIDIGIIGMAQWPPRGLDGVRLIPAFLTGVLLPREHPLSQRERIRVADLAPLTWYHLRPDATWDVFAYLRERLRSHGLSARKHAARPGGYAFLPQIAAGDGWALADDRLRDEVRDVHKGVVFRPIEEDPFELWVTAIWRKGASSPSIRSFVEVARRLCKSAEEVAPARPLRSPS